MLAPVEARAVPLDDLLKRGDEWVEVVDGEIVEIKIMLGYEHSIIIDNLLDILKPFARQHKLGRVFGDGLTYLLHITEAGVRTARIADLSFIRHDKERRDFDLKLPYPGAPDLAVEVVSPSEDSAELLAKMADYLRYGTEQVWVIYPEPKELHVYFRDQNLPLVYKTDAIFEPAALFPGLKITIADLFRREED
jgi:Uma2 family endonuclease